MEVRRAAPASNISIMTVHSSLIVVICGLCKDELTSYDNQQRMISDQFLL